ncbi:hypothetical protein NKJ84_23420, partial [Mesorhizobium sp. M0048]|uniref:hypothetical protein n=1 Tax=Mesorhizobium sp. M0048 TaxID=2956860 RepID=UPI003337CE67
SPNTLSTASTPPGKNRKVLPMCPVQIVTYVSGRSSNFFNPAGMDVEFSARRILDCLGLTGRSASGRTAALPHAAHHLSRR